MKRLLVDHTFTLKKMPGKGGWTYVVISHLLENVTTSFGWIKVSGTVDGFAFGDYKIMRIASGELFFPVKAQIRKAIKKEEGDEVHLIIFLEENAPLSVSEQEILECLKDEPKAFFNFNKLTKANQTAHFEYILLAKTDDEKVKRITDLIKKMLI